MNDEIAFTGFTRNQNFILCKPGFKLRPNSREK